MLARIPLASTMLLITFLTLLGTVLAFVAIPMAGELSAAILPAVVAILAVPMAFAFTHGADAHPHA